MMVSFGHIATLRVSLSAALLHLFHIVSLAAAPANDNFADRIPVEGSHLEISGSFEGATYENNERQATITHPVFSQRASVWFSWKAPETGLYLVTPKTFLNYGLITVSTGSTILDAQHFQNVLAELQFQTPLHPARYATFHAERDTEYVIRASGEGSFAFSIVLTNHPIILEHPRTRTTSEGWNAFFSVGAALRDGELPTLQWQFNGVDLPGRTGPILAITNVTAESAGEYRVVARSPDTNGGFLSRTSSVANLFVKPAPKPVLTIQKHADGGIYVHLENPEIGRFYQMHSRFFTSLNWVGPMTLGDQHFPFRLRETMSGEPIKGYIAHLEVRGPRNNICDLNLQRIYFAKHRLSHDRQLTTADSFAEADLQFYFGEPPQCPAGGIYNYHPIGAPPVCSLIAAQQPFTHGHDFPVQ